MSRKALIQIRRGLEKDISTLAIGELGYCEDSKKLYIGTKTGNVLLAAAQAVGDMLKTIYDTNNNGKVDIAEVADKAPWNGITGKPSIFPPSGHTHTKDQISNFPSSLPANGGNADTVDGKHASEFLYKEGNNYFTFGSTGSGIAGKWYEVMTWKINSQYNNFQTRIFLTQRGCKSHNGELCIRGEYGANSWSSYEIKLTGDKLDTRETFLLVLNNLTRTATLYYKKNYDWDLTIGVILVNYLSGATFNYNNIPTNSTTTPNGDITLIANKTHVTWNDLKGVQ